ncbi:MAG: oligosaccharide flippase family protein [Bacillota bacterium]
MNTLAPKRSRLPKFINDFINYFSGFILIKALSLFSLPILTRLLTTEDYGTFNVLWSYIGLFTILLTLNSQSAIGRGIYEKRDDESHELLGTTFIFNIFILSLFFIMFILFRQQIARLLTLPVEAVLFIVPIVFARTISSFFELVYRAFRESKKVMIVTFIQAYLVFGITVLFIFHMNKDKYLGQVWANLIVGLLFTIYFFAQIKPHMKISVSKSSLKYIFSFSVPLIPFALSGLILDQFDRVMINSYYGASEAGLYSFAYNIGSISSMFWSVLFATWIPVYFRLMNNKNYIERDNNMDKLFRIAVFVTALLMFFSQEVGLILGKKTYMQSISLVPVISLGLLFNAIFGIYSKDIEYAKKTTYASLIVLICGAINIILNLIFIPKYGYKAGAYTTLISYVIMAILAWLVTSRILKLSPTPLKIIVKPLIILIIVIIPFYNFILRLNNLWLAFIIKIILIFTLGFILFFKYKEVFKKYIFKYIRGV